MSETLWALFWFGIAAVWTWIILTWAQWLIPAVRLSLTYRAERRWLDRDPYGYMRMALGLPPSVTDADIDRVVTVELPALMRQAGVSAEEFGTDLLRVIRASGEADRGSDKGSDSKPLSVE